MWPADELMTASINIIRGGSKNSLRMIISVVCWGSSHIRVIILIMEKTTGRKEAKNIAKNGAYLGRGIHKYSVTSRKKEGNPGQMMKKWQQCQQLLKKDVSTNKRQQRPETKKIYALPMLFRSISAPTIPKSFARCPPRA